MPRLHDLPTMAIAWEGFEAPGRLARIEQVSSGREAFHEQFQLEFRVVLAAAMVRVAEGDLRWHQDQAHFVRSFIARRKVARRKKQLLRASDPVVIVGRPALAAAAAEPRQLFRRKPAELLPGPETGDRVVSYLQLGVHSSRDVRRDLGPKIPRVIPHQYRR
jgi:hypothetical protein